MDYDVDRVFDVVTRLLPEAGVACLMIGGHAVNHYGVVRATQDIEFMIAGDDDAVVRRVMTNAGFTNIASHEIVIFYNRPGSPLRVDFLKVDAETLRTLLAEANVVAVSDGAHVRVPRLQDLIAMKLFALSGGDPRREDKDFPDIVHLVITNGLDADAELKPLCDRFGTPALFDRLRTRIQALQGHA